MENRVRDFCAHLHNTFEVMFQILLCDKCFKIHYKENKYYTSKHIFLTLAFWSYKQECKSARICTL